MSETVTPDTAVHDAPPAVYHLSDEELIDRQLFLDSMIDEGDYFDWEVPFVDTDPDDAYIAYVESRQLYEQDGLLS